MTPTSFQADLLTWFERCAREMPWRASRDPYAIWVSEIMLQQTQVATVRPYFERFMQAFPTVFALAAAPQEKVLKRWEGLGYYSRARNLQRGAQLVVSAYDGKIPRSLDEILKVPGIGPYSAGAILSIAFGLPVPAIDGNVIRVFSRLDTLRHAFDTAPPRRALTERVAVLIPPARAGDFNQALMELGALVCKPRQPLCTDCPVQAHCRAYAEGQPEQYPYKGKKTQVKTLLLDVAVIQDGQGRVLLQQQTRKGIFKGLWCLPWRVTEDAAESRLAGQSLCWGEPLTLIEHVLTHRRLQMQVRSARWQGVPGPDLVWVNPAQNQDYAVPVAHQKILGFVNAHPLLFEMYAEQR